MKIDELRDMLALSLRLSSGSIYQAYSDADKLLPVVLEARKTKWAVVDENNKPIHVCDDLATAERRCGTSYRVLPYKEPKP